MNASKQTSPAPHVLAQQNLDRKASGRFGQRSSRPADDVVAAGITAPTPIVAVAPATISGALSERDRTAAAFAQITAQFSGSNRLAEISAYDAYISAEVSYSDLAAAQAAARCDSLLALGEAQPAGFDRDRHVWAGTRNASFSSDMRVAEQRAAAAAKRSAWADAASSAWAQKKAASPRTYGLVAA